MILQNGVQFLVDRVPGASSGHPLWSETRREELYHPVYRYPATLNFQVGSLGDQVSSLILRLLGIDPKSGGQRYLSSKESPCSGQPISDNRHSASLEKKRRVAPSCLTDVFSIIVVNCSL